MVSVSGQQFLIGLYIVALWGAAFLILAFVNIPEKNIATFNLFLGGVLGAGTTVLAFFFPSSIGARSKDEAITKLTDAVAAQTTPAPSIIVTAPATKAAP